MYKPIDKEEVKELIISGDVKLISTNPVFGEHTLSLDNKYTVEKLFTFKLNSFKNNYMCLNLTAGNHVNNQEKFELYLMVLIEILNYKVSEQPGRGFVNIKSKDPRILEPLYEMDFKRIRVSRNLSIGDKDPIYSGMRFFGEEE